MTRLGVSLTPLFLLSVLAAMAQSSSKPKAPPDPRLRLLEASRSEPVEVEAYVFRKLLEKGSFLGPKEVARRRGGLGTGPFLRPIGFPSCWLTRTSSMATTGWRSNQLAG
jgi:hypothetical protein